MPDSLPDRHHGGPVYLFVGLIVMHVKLSGTNW